VCGIVEVLQAGVGDPPMNEDARRFIDDIRSETELMTAILNDVLDLSRLNAGKLDIEPRVFDPLAALQRIVEARAAPLRAAGKPVDILLETRGEPLRAWCSDETRFRQIANNLVSEPGRWWRWR
jgi:two-component system sensor histidine kinase/response regulator